MILRSIIATSVRVFLLFFYKMGVSCVYHGVCRRSNLFILAINNDAELFRYAKIGRDEKYKIPMYFHRKK